MPSAKTKFGTRENPCRDDPQYRLTHQDECGRLNFPAGSSSNVRPIRPQPDPGPGPGPGPVCPGPGCPPHPIPTPGGNIPGVFPFVPGPHLFPIKAPPKAPTLGPFDRPFDEMRAKFIKSALRTGEDIDDVMKEYADNNTMARKAFLLIDSIHEDLGLKKNPGPKNAYTKEYLDDINANVDKKTKQIIFPDDMDHELVRNGMANFTKRVIDKVHNLIKSDYQLNKQNLDKLNIRERLDTLSKYADDLKKHISDINNLKGTQAQKTIQEGVLKADFLKNFKDSADLNIDSRVNRTPGAGTSTAPPPPPPKPPPPPPKQPKTQKQIDRLAALKKIAAAAKGPPGPPPGAPPPGPPSGPPGDVPDEQTGGRPPDEPPPDENRRALRLRGGAPKPLKGILTASEKSAFTRIKAAFFSDDPAMLKQFEDEMKDAGKTNVAPKTKEFVEQNFKDHIDKETYNKINELEAGGKLADASEMKLEALKHRIKELEDKPDDGKVPQKKQKEIDDRKEEHARFKREIDSAHAAMKQEIRNRDAALHKQAQKVVEDAKAAAKAAEMRAAGKAKADFDRAEALKAAAAQGALDKIEADKALAEKAAAADSAAEQAKQDAIKRGQAAAKAALDAQEAAKVEEYNKAAAAKAAADQAAKDKAAADKAAADKANADAKKAAADAKRAARNPTKGDIAKGITDISKGLKKGVGQKVESVTDAADALKKQVQDRLDLLKQMHQDALDPQHDVNAKYAKAGLSSKVLTPAFGDDLAGDDPELAKASKVVAVADHLGPAQPAQPVNVQPAQPAQITAEIMAEHKAILDKITAIGAQLDFGDLTDAEKADLERQQEEALNELVDAGNVEEIQKRYNPSARTLDSIRASRRLRQIRNTGPSSGPASASASQRSSVQGFDNPSDIPTDFDDVHAINFDDLFNLPLDRPPSAPSSARPSTSNTPRSSARGSFPTHPNGTTLAARIPAPPRPNTLDRISDKFKRSISSARPAPRDRPDPGTYRQSASARGPPRSISTSTITHNVGNTPSLHSTPLTPGVGISGLGVSGTPHTPAGSGTSHTPAGSYSAVNTSDISHTGASGITRGLRGKNTSGYSRLSDGGFRRGGRLALPDLRFDPSRISRPVREAIGRAGGAMGRAGSGTVDYVRSGMTRENAIGAIKASPENVSSALLGMYAYNVTQKGLDNVWKDKSDGAKFTKSLVAAEVGNFVGTAGLYAGKGIVPVFQSTFKAGGAMIRGGSGLGSLGDDAKSVASNFGKLMNMKSFGAMAGEFGMNVFKGGGTVLLSMAAGAGAEALMKSSGVKSHAALEGVESLTEGVVGLGAMFAMDLLGGPVGALMAVGQIGMIAYAFIHGAQEDHRERVLRQREREKENQERAERNLSADTNMAKMYFYRHFAEAGYDYDKAWELARADPKWQQVLEVGVPKNAESKARFMEDIDNHFSRDGLLTKPGASGPEPTDPVSILYAKKYQYELALHQQRAGNKDITLPPNLTSEEMSYLNLVTNGTYLWDIYAQVELTATANIYATQQVGDAQQQILKAWQTGSLTAEDMIDPTIMQLASLDPNFEPFYRQAIMLDAQRQVIQAFNTDSMLLDDLPYHLTEIAMSDGNFMEIYKNYTRKMVEMSDFYGISIQDLAEKMNMTDEEAQALQDNLKAEQDRQLDEIRKMNQQVVDKMNSKLAAQISAYGDDLPNVIRNLNDSLALQGRSEYVGMSATDLFNFLKATAPDVTLDIPDPGPPFVYDPTKIIDTKPTINYATESLTTVRKMEMKIRAERLGTDITEADRRRIQYEVQNPGREYIDEYTRQNEIDNAQRLGISINAWRRLEDRRKAQEQKEVDILIAQRMGISVDDLIRIRTVNTPPDQDIRNNITPEGPTKNITNQTTKPDEPKTYTDAEIEDLFGDRVDMFAYYMSRADAIKQARDEQYQKELMEIRDRPGSGYGNNIYEVPEDPLELERENQIVDDRNAADQAAADKAAADQAAADQAAAAGENSGTQDAVAPATPAPNIS